MTSPIYNPDTARIIERTINTLPHAVLLQGVNGVGLATAARSIAWRDIAAFIQSTDRDGNIDTSAKGIIRVPQIRELIEQTRGKTTKRQVFIIDEADKMNPQAQNAFLKLLEEPTPHIHFILTSHAPHQLLPTVLSRVQRVTVKPISTDTSRQLIAKLRVNDPRKIQQLLFLANGKPAELSRLIQNESLFNERAKLMTDARELIQGTPYQRTLVVTHYYSDRAKCLQLLELAQNIATFSLEHTPSNDLVALLSRLEQAYERIAANGNVRLQLMNFVVQ